MVVDFWFEFASTYSYPTAMRIEEEAARRGIEIRWRAFLLGPIFHTQGWDDSPFNLYKAKGDYMWRDIARTCEALEIPFQQPSVFPRNGLLPARVVCTNEGAPWIPTFVRAVYQTNFAYDLDISDTAVVADCLAQSGQDPDVILTAAQTLDAKTILREQTDLADKLGLFGAPSFMVGDELFWGGDRMEDALAWAVALDTGLPK